MIFVSVPIGVRIFIYLIGGTIEYDVNTKNTLVVFYSNILLCSESPRTYTIGNVDALYINVPKLKVACKIGVVRRESMYVLKLQAMTPYFFFYVLSA